MRSLSKSTATTLLALAATSLLTGCGYADPAPDNNGSGPVAGTLPGQPSASPSPSASPVAGADDFNAGSGLTMVTLPDGLKYVDLVAGTGKQPAKGDSISVQYTGWTTDGKKFDSSRDRGAPATFEIGTGKVIAGWDEAVITIKVGGKRKLIIPPALGYGTKGQPPAIPANATLVFIVEMVEVMPAPPPTPSASPTP
ncbi:MAG: FKBP-type peptidyl-prolyl cis-trans isomerase [Candidatus Dormibacteraeota bacterium]|nr:FKBP-type peptidyl-prolyl cis-trans isomerase [Candidatus Dormibacteraeota bacterium]